MVEKKTPSEFLPENCWEEVVKKIFFIFDNWPRIQTQTFASNKPTHYILDHGDFNIIYRTSIKNSFKSSTVIQREISRYFNVPSRTALLVCILEKPLVYRKYILRSHESKFCRFGSDGKSFVWPSPNMQHNPKYTSQNNKTCCRKCDGMDRVFWAWHWCYI